VGTSIVHIRGQLTADLDIAWLHRRDTWKCSGDPSFDVLTDQGARVHVVVDPETDWRSLATTFTGRWSSLAEHDRTNAFRPGPYNKEDKVEHRRVVLQRDASLDVWGTPSYDAVEGSYREREDGALEGVSALRVRLAREDTLVPLSRGKIAGSVCAGALAAIAVAMHAPSHLLSFALLVGMLLVHALHRDAVPWLAVRPPSRHKRVWPRASELASELWFVLFMFSGDEPWGHVWRGSILAVVLAAWGVATLRHRHAKAFHALLSPSAMEGIVHEGHVLTTAGALAPEDIAVTWIARGSKKPEETPAVVDGEPSTAEGKALAAARDRGFSPEDGESARVARVGERWALLRGEAPPNPAKMLRQRRWNQVMPWVYFASASLSIASALWPR